MNDNNGETVIDLIELLGAFIKKIWLVIILTILGAGIAFGYSFLFIFTRERYFYYWISKNSAKDFSSNNLPNGI